VSAIGATYLLVNGELDIRVWQRGPVWRLPYTTAAFHVWSVTQNLSFWTVSNTILRRCVVAALLVPFEALSDVTRQQLHAFNSRVKSNFSCQQIVYWCWHVSPVTTSVWRDSCNKPRLTQCRAAAAVAKAFGHFPQ